ncbi:hypothetical protein [Blastopirellula retiformator]|uniref:Uncharacterized protein n=1 Tax=Blastopirellula retiformator TaxID=2527970 RepID=A0A5C5UWV9_9BACT|nr:hypothetical protein [Blastopirellula retiformator]TWT30866.1 hypothetical protein Enr8_43920 [Blastopirellula retiformator]
MTLVDGYFDTLNQQQAAAEETQKKLQTPVSCNFSVFPLTEVAKFLGEKAGVEIRIDKRSLEDMGPLIYPLADLPKKLNFATDRDPVGGAPAERSLDELITAVSLPSTDESAEQENSLLGSADCRMIIQTEAEHRKLVQFLTALRKSHSQLQPGTPGRRTIEYRLFDSNGDQLSPNRLGVVAIRLQAELRQLDWDDNEHFIVVDKELVISQTDAGHKAIYRKLIEWWITAKTDAPLFPPAEPQGAK